MNCLSMACKNLRKKFSFYGLYLLSVSLVITVFFAFTSFSMNHVMLEKISSDGRVEAMCNTISVFLMVFVVFYMAYSNRFFLRRRTRELGIYTLLGYRKSAVLSLLILENAAVCLGAFIVGIFFGAIAHNGITAGITALLNLSADNGHIPLFNENAVIKTACFIFCVVIVLAISNGRCLLGTTLIELIRYEKKAEKGMKCRPAVAFTGFLMIAAGYGVAADILRGADSVWITFGFYLVGLFTMTLVVTGTVLFILSFLPYIIQGKKKNKKAFYTDIKIITIPNFIYRIRFNARTLIMLTLLSAAALTVSGVMALSLYYPIAAVSRIAPSEIEFRIEDESQGEKIREIVRTHIPDEEVSFIQTDICKVTSTGENLPVEYSLGTAKGDADNENIVRERGFECISYSDYTRLLYAQGKDDVAAALPVLSDMECIVVKYQPDSDGSSEAGSVYSLSAESGAISVRVREVTLDNPISFANSVGTLIVSDRVSDEIKADSGPSLSIMSMNGEGLKKNENLYKEIEKALEGSPYLQGNSHRIHELISLNSSTFLLIGFLVILFFIAAGSILYFNNITAISDSRGDYEILLKMGYTHRHIKRIIRKQVLVFYAIPFILGLLDCIFATIVYKTGLMQNLLGNSFTLYIPSIIAIALSALIYGIYYCITVHSCCKIICRR